MSTRQDAKQAVLDIAKKYGFVDEKVWEDIRQWRPEYGRLLEESFLAKDKFSGHIIKTYVPSLARSSLLLHGPWAPVQESESLLAHMICLF